MMKDYLLLLRVNLKTMLRGAATDSMRTGNGKLKPSYILLYILAGVGMLTLAGMIIWMETALYQVASGMNLLPGMKLEKLLIGMAFLMSMIATLIFGVFHTLAAMYFNRDTVATAHLPIGPRTQMMARWTEIYLGEILFSLVLLTPLLVNHGIAQGGGVGYYATMLLMLLITPLYPLSIALLLSSLLARFSSFTKNKEVWVVIGTVLMLVVVLGGEWLLIPQIPEDADSMFFLRLLMNNEALLSYLIGAFPPVMWAVNAISGSGLMLALYVLVGVAAIALVILLMGGSFQRVCLMHTEQGTTRKQKVKRGETSFAAASPFLAIFRREMNEVFKTPVYLLNAVMSVLMMPIMLIAMSVGASAESEGVDLLATVGELIASLHPLDLTLILAAIFSFMVLMSPIPATAISREGKRLPIMRMIPVPARTILWAKLAVNLVVVGVGSVIMGAALVIVLGAAYLPHVAGAVLIGNVLALVVGAGSILIDVMRPLLNWKSENEVMKQNMNVMFSMLVSVVAVALIVVPVVLLHAQAAWMRFAAAVTVLAAELALSLVLMKTVGESRLSRLEP